MVGSSGSSPRKTAVPGPITSHTTVNGRSFDPLLRDIEYFEKSSECQLSQTPELPRLEDEKDIDNEM